VRAPSCSSLEHREALVTLWFSQWPELSTRAEILSRLFSVGLAAASAVVVDLVGPPLYTRWWLISACTVLAFVFARLATWGAANVRGLPMVSAADAKSRYARQMSYGKLIAQIIMLLLLLLIVIDIFSVGPIWDLSNLRNKLPLIIVFTGLMILHQIRARSR
jgi:uncharacterized integral membrane protein